MGRDVCFFFQGGIEASSGVYGPHGYRVHPRGEDVAEHHLMHLHEIHHKVLNDDTPWGSLVHAAARHPGWESLLEGLFDSCRTVHEAFASFMSFSLARSRHERVEDVLARYPVYWPLAQRFERFLREVPGSHRMELAATGVARWSMSAPVLEMAVAKYPQMLTLADLPTVMRPDHRFRMLLAGARHAVAGAVQAADEAFERVCGRDVQTAGVEGDDALLDAAWALWEDAFVEAVVRSVPFLAAMPATPRDGHLDSADALVEAAGVHGVHLELPRASPDAGPISDVESVRRLLQAVTLPLRDAPYAGALASAGAEVDLDDILALSAAGARAHLVVHGRTPSHLARAFSFGESDRRRLAEGSAGPVFAARNVVDDGDGGELILHTVFDEPAALEGAFEAWQGRGVAAVCLTASCFLEASWQGVWGAALREWPKVVLLDMGLPAMVGPGSLLGGDTAVHSTYMGLGRPDIGALVWHVDGHPHVLLAVGDDLTIQLIAGQLRDLVGDRLVMEEADWSPWLEVLSAVTSTVLATEPFLRFDGATFGFPGAEGLHGHQ